MKNRSEFMSRLVRTWPFVALYRLRYASESTCMHCGLPWSAVEDIHFVDMTRVTDGHCREGFFLCCERCWNKLTLEEKEAYAGRLYIKWVLDGSKPNFKFRQMIDAIDMDLPENRGTEFEEK